MGFETAESIARFIQVLGLSLAGAGSFWAWRLVYLSRRHSNENLVTLAKQLYLQILLGAIVLGAGWVLFELANPATAQAFEGLSLSILNLDQIAIHQLELIILIITAVPVGVLIWVIKNGRTNTLHLEWIYFILFVLLSVYCLVPLAVLPAQAGLFTGLHRWVAIPTLGTALTAAWLYLFNRHQVTLLSLMGQFRAFTTVMWLGLAFEFMNNLTIFNQALQINTRFIFMQVLVGLIVLNGVFLGQAIVARMRQIVKQEKVQLSHRFEALLLFSGAIAISAWLALAWADAFTVIGYSLETLLLGYILFMALIWSVSRLVIKLEV